ncbi:di-trans,poly-cis-decaprenylcistransferase [SAR202 cluster bacterium AD-804-J14_MRT_500m]|nr:di-trans,poly-cis-decaprenylcistransferase [SAR202 cluster bacterium AD-804-J14_MRT_500m]
MPDINRISNSDLSSQLPGKPNSHNLPVPRHVAIIMDGNGRWATERGLSRNDGHRAGVEKLREVLKWLGEAGVEYVTIYAFSTENWSRPQGEVDGIISILRSVIEKETQDLHKRGVRIIMLGRTNRLDTELRKAVERSQGITQANSRMTLCVAFDYGGRQEILDAVKAVIRDGISPESLDETLFSTYLDTHNIPEPDLIIRTGGDQRLSNFLLWQSAYSEFFFTPKSWPSLDSRDIESAIQSYRSRDRRFGSIDPEN